MKRIERLDEKKWKLLSFSCYVTSSHYMPQQEWETCRVIRVFLKRWKQITIMLEAEKYILRCVRDKGNFEFTPQDVRYCNLSFLYKERSGIRSKFHIVKERGNIDLTDINLFHRDVICYVLVEFVLVNERYEIIGQVLAS